MGKTKKRESIKYFSNAIIKNSEHLIQPGEFLVLIYKARYQWWDISSVILVVKTRIRREKRKNNR